MWRGRPRPLPWQFKLVLKLLLNLFLNLFLDVV